MAFFIKSLTTPAKPFWTARKMPNDSSVIGLFLPRQSEIAGKSNADIATKNLSIVANSNLPAFGAIGGSPVFNAGFVNFTAFQNYIETGVAETGSLTWMVVARLPPAAPLPTVSNLNRGILASAFDSTGGGLMYFYSDTAPTPNLLVRGQVSNSANVVQARAVAATEATLRAWGLYAMVASPTSIQVFDLTNNPTTVPLTIVGHTVNTKGIQIGSSRSTSFNGGQSDVAAALFANTAYTAQQLADAKAIFNTELSAYSISV